MSDPIMRVFLVLELLQGRDHVTGAQLAERLQVDLRTVQRYIVRLRELGVPVSASPGVGGAYRLRPGFRLPPLLLTNEEAFALSLGLRALRQVGLEAFAPATEGALAKLTRVMPERLRESIQTVEDAVAMEPSPWAAPASLECLTAAATAIRTSHRVRFAYTSHQQADTQRHMEPYAVLHADSRWYLIGHCLTRNAMRSFRMDRITQLTLCAESFDPPAGFDARRYLAETMPFIQAEHQIEVWIDMPVEEAGRSFALWRVSVEAEGSGCRLRCTRDQLDTFAAMMLSTGRRVVVRSPPALRETFRHIAELALQAADDSPQA